MAFIFFTPVFTEVYIVEQLVLQTIYVLKKSLQFLALKSGVYDQGRFQIILVKFQLFMKT